MILALASYHFISIFSIFFIFSKQNSFYDYMNSFFLLYSLFYSNQIGSIFLYKRKEVPTRTPFPSYHYRQLRNFYCILPWQMKSILIIKMPPFHFRQCQLQVPKNRYEPCKFKGSEAIKPLPPLLLGLSVSKFTSVIQSRPG